MGSRQKYRIEVDLRKKQKSNPGMETKYRPLLLFKRPERSTNRTTGNEYEPDDFHYNTLNTSNCKV